MMDRVRMLWKLALSYRKREWELQDYPLRIRVQKDTPESDRYWARVLGWNLDATGPSKDLALSELQRFFDLQRASRAEKGKPVPRPGTRVPIEFASTERLDAHEDLKHDFIRRILQLDWAFISDESSLVEFASGDLGEYVSRIRETYGVDISDIEAAKLHVILDRIAKHRDIPDVSRHVP